MKTRRSIWLELDITRPKGRYHPFCASPSGPTGRRQSGWATASSHNSTRRPRARGNKKREISPWASRRIATQADLYLGQCFLWPSSTCFFFDFGEKHLTQVGSPSVGVSCFNFDVLGFYDFSDEVHRRGKS